MQNESRDATVERDQLSSEISTLQTLNKSLQEKLQKTSDQLAETEEEKNKHEKLVEELERDKKEVEEKSQQHELKINQLLSAKEVHILINI